MVQATAVTQEVTGLSTESVGALQRLRWALDSHPGSLKIVLAGSSDPFPEQFRLLRLNSKLVVEPTASLICSVQARWLQEHFLPAIGLRGERSRLTARDLPNWQLNSSQAELLESEAQLRAAVEALTADDYTGIQPRLCVYEFSTQTDRCGPEVELCGDTLRFTVPSAVKEAWALHRAHFVSQLLHTAGRGRV